MRLITWNVARRVEALAAQAAALGGRAPDVVALQEVTARTLPLWEAALPVLGLPAVACSLRDADPARAPAGRRRTGVLLAARALEPLPGLLPVPWPETALAARVDGTEVHTVHVPNAANGGVKPETLAAVARGAGRARGPADPLRRPQHAAPRAARRHRLVVRARLARAPARRARRATGTPGELGVVPGLADLGFADAFRALHGYAERSPSWTFRRIAGHGGGWRLDHVFAAGLEPVAARYHHDWRERGLSDHAALEADLG